MKLHSKIYGWDYVWRDFADEMKGQLVEDESTGKPSITSLYVPVPAESWILTFNPFVYRGHKTHTGTTVTAAFNALDDFSFAIYNEKLGSQFSKLLGMQDLQIGEAAFDSKFIVQGSDKARVLDLFGDVQLQDLVLAQPESLQFRILAETSSAFHSEWRVPPGYKVLAYTQESLVDDFNVLQSIYELMVISLKQLCAIGATGTPISQPAPQRALRSVFLQR